MWMATSGVHRMKRASSLPAKAAVSVVATVSGALAGWVVALVSGLLSFADRAQVVFRLAVVLTLMPLLRLPLPQRDVETPQALLSAGPLVWAAGNGGLLGLGIASRIGFWVWYVLPLGVFALAQPVLGLCLWEVYGFTRLTALAVVAAGMRPGDDAAARLTSRLIEMRSRMRPAMTWLAVVAAAAIAVSAA
jgi:hypothetical protein